MLLDRAALSQNRSGRGWELRLLGGMYYQVKRGLGGHYVHSAC
jgi:hypothetical protein